MQINQVGTHPSGDSVFKMKLAAMIFYFLLLCATLPLVVYADTIKIGGSGSALATMEQLGDAFVKSHPEHNIKVLPSLGSGGGIKALQGHALDIAVISRELKPDEAATGLTATEYGITPFVFAVHRKVPASNITLLDIAAIYAGKKLAWENGEQIRLVLRPASDSDTVLLNSISPKMEAAVNIAQQRPGMVFAMTDIDSVDNLESMPGSFGTSTLALILAENRKIKALPVNGVTPSISNLENGSYPYWKPINMVTDKTTSHAAQQFIAFVKSPEGQQYLEKLGHHVRK
jgi:phosphate transport system substrate-binding protein